MLVSLNELIYVFDIQLDIFSRRSKLSYFIWFPDLQTTQLHFSPLSNLASILAFYSMSIQSPPTNSLMNSTSLVNLPTQDPSGPLISPVSQLFIKLTQLPHDLEVLPPQIVDQLTQLHDVLSAYVKQLSQFNEKNDEIVGILNQQIDKLNQIIQIFDEYLDNSKIIDNLIQDITELYDKFSNLDLIQYKLQSANFNQDLLKAKFEKLIDSNKQESIAFIRDYKLNNSQLEGFLNQFKESRKTYHLRQEKLNRWDEERVAGFI